MEDELHRTHAESERLVEPQRRDVRRLRRDARAARPGFGERGRDERASQAAARFVRADIDEDDLRILAADHTDEAVRAIRRHDGDAFGETRARPDSIHLVDPVRWNPGIAAEPAPARERHRRGLDGARVVRTGTARAPIGRRVDALRLKLRAHVDQQSAPAYSRLDLAAERRRAGEVDEVDTLGTCAVGEPLERLRTEFGGRHRDTEELRVPVETPHAAMLAAARGARRTSGRATTTASSPGAEPEVASSTRSANVVAGHPRVAGRPSYRTASTAKQRGSRF